MPKYRNLITQAVITTTCVITGDNWEEVDESAEEAGIPVEESIEEENVGTEEMPEEPVKKAQPKAPAKTARKTAPAKSAGKATRKSGGK